MSNVVNTDAVVNKLVEIGLRTSDDFLKVAETLTRIGIASKSAKKLFQSCHILHKRKKYYIVHFKELFELDGKQSTMSDSDIGRRNSIIDLLSEWELIDVIDTDKIIEPRTPMSQIKVLTFSEKKNWELVPKYPIGKRTKEQ